MLTTCSVTNKLHLIADYCIFCDGESEIFYNSIVELKLEHEYDISCINSTLRRGQHTNARSWYLYCLTSTDCNNTSQRERPERPNRGSVGSTRRHHHHWCRSVGPLPNIVLCSAPSVPQPVFTITEKAPTRAFSWLKALTSTFTFKTLLRHYAKWVLTPW